MLPLHQVSVVCPVFWLVFKLLRIAGRDDLGVERPVYVGDSYEESNHFETVQSSSNGGGMHG